MSSFLDQVTPLTRGIIWLTENDKNPQNSFYRDLDYLLDGLLTANLLTTGEVSSRVIVGSNFDKPFYVLIVKKVVSSEVESYLSLFQKELVSENDILVVDEAKNLDALRPLVKPILNQIRVIE